MTAEQSSPFLRLPTEIRLMIYELLLLPSSSGSGTSTPKRNPKITAPAYHEYEVGSNSNTFAADPRTLRIRTMDPTSVPVTARTRYHIRSDRFRSRIMTTTYTLQYNPGLHTAILQTCRQCHVEAGGLLYSSYTFDFDTNVEAIVPFLSDLTPVARASINRIAVVKRALPYVKEFDRAEWSRACEYMARELRLPSLTLSLGVVAGKPGAQGWDDVPELTVEHFRLVQPRSVGSRTSSASSSGATTPVDEQSPGQLMAPELVPGLGLKAIAGVDFEWVEQLMWLRGMREMQVKAIIEHCPPPMSETMAFWVSFSKSVESSFREWMRGIMIA